MNWFLDLFGSFDKPEFQKSCLASYEDLALGQCSWVESGIFSGYKWGARSQDYMFEEIEEPHGYPSHIIAEFNGNSNCTVTASYIVSDMLKPIISFQIKNGKIDKIATVFWLGNRTNRIRFNLEQPENQNIGIFHPNFYKNDLAKMSAITALNNCDGEMLKTIIEDS